MNQSIGVSIILCAECCEVKKRCQRNEHVGAQKQRESKHTERKAHRMMMPLHTPNYHRSEEVKDAQCSIEAEWEAGADLPFAVGASSVIAAGRHTFKAADDTAQLKHMGGIQVMSVNVFCLRKRGNSGISHREGKPRRRQINKQNEIMRQSLVVDSTVLANCPNILVIKPAASSGEIWPLSYRPCAHSFCVLRQASGPASAFFHDGRPVRLKR